MHDRALAEALRSTDFGAAQCAALEFGRGVRLQVEAAGDDGVRAAAICQEALDTLRDHLHLARVLRAHLAAQLLANAGSSLYFDAATGAHHLWQFEG